MQLQSSRIEQYPTLWVVCLFVCLLLLLLLLLLYLLLLLLFQKSTLEQTEFWKARDNILQSNLYRICYDSMMLMAMALNKSIDDLKFLDPPRKLQNFNYHDSDMRRIFNQNIRHTEFTGFSVSNQLMDYSI